MLKSLTDDDDDDNNNNNNNNNNNSSSNNETFIASLFEQSCRFETPAPPLIEHVLFRMPNKPHCVMHFIVIIVALYRGGRHQMADNGF